MSSALYTDMVNGFKLFPGFIDRKEAGALVRCLGDLVAQAPLITPRMPRTGKPFSVAVTNAGSHGWYSDKQGGYRYQPCHPETGAPWPAIPQQLLDLWRALHPESPSPQCCLINYYEDPGARMGLHVDADEDNIDAPILSISLGDTALFRLGGLQRGGPTRSLKLSSGDIVSLGGEARRAFHGIDRLYPGTSTLLAQNGFRAGGRLNITLRRVT
jgi:alkylated DNA repair protein (DNA oxidative demethylase)